MEKGKANNYFAYIYFFKITMFTYFWKVQIITRFFLNIFFQDKVMPKDIYNLVLNDTLWVAYGINHIQCQDYLEVIILYSLSFLSHPLQQRTWWQSSFKKITPSWHDSYVYPSLWLNSIVFRVCKQNFLYVPPHHFKGVLRGFNCLLNVNEFHLGRI